MYSLFIRFPSSARVSQSFVPTEISQLFVVCFLTTMHIAVFFNLFGGGEPQGCIPVDRGTPVHISAQES